MMQCNVNKPTNNTTELLGENILDSPEITIFSIVCLEALDRVVTLAHVVTDCSCVSDRARRFHGSMFMSMDIHGTGTDKVTIR